MSNSLKATKISVVIPVKDREDTIGRALESVLSQEGDFSLEVIVVDDGSTDQTKSVAEEYLGRQKNVSLIRNEKSVGGALARNRGAEASSGEFIAFLDSDDAWRPNHLNHKLALLAKEKAQGCFGSFNVMKNDKVNPFDLPLLRNGNIAEYILSEGGDTRTSTFLFERKAFMDVMFDDKLAKHQDWDLTIRFSEKYKLVHDPLKTVDIYINAGNRMSYANAYSASDYFLDKHKGKIGKQSLYNFKLNICFNAFRFEGYSEDFKRRLKELTALGKDPKVKHKPKYYLMRYYLLRIFLPALIILHRRLKYGG